MPETTTTADPMARALPQATPEVRARVARLLAAMAGGPRAAGELALAAGGRSGIDLGVMEMAGLASATRSGYRLMYAITPKGLALLEAIRAESETTPNLEGNA